MKTCHSIVLNLATATLFVSCNQADRSEDVFQTAYSPEIEDRIQRVIDNLQAETHLADQYESGTLYDRMEYFQTPGISIAVINQGKVEWTRGFGLKEWGNSEKVDGNTLFMAGSVSKPVFGLAVMKLYQEGKLDLDTDVNQYLTSWKVPPVGDWQPKVTLRQLLSHTAGCTVHGFPGYLRSEEIPTTVQILDGVPPANTASVRVNILPGTQTRYSGGGVTIAQLAVSDLLQKPFAEIMREQIFTPLELERSTYEQTLKQPWSANASTGHPWKYQAIVGGSHVYPEMAAAGLWTTSGDLARLGVEVQKGLKGESEFFSQETMKEMLTPQKIASEIGISFFLNGEGEDVRFVHSGWDEGFVSDFQVYRDKGMGAVVMVNSNQGNPLIREIMRAIASVYDWPGFFPDPRTYAEVDRQVLETYTGFYRSNSGLKGEVRLEDNRLAFEYQGQPQISLDGLNDSTFVSEFLNLSIQFEPSRDGGSFTLKQQWKTHRLTREQE